MELVGTCFYNRPFLGPSLLHAKNIVLNIYTYINVLNTLNDYEVGTIIFFLGRYYYYPHFIDEELKHREEQ